MILIPTLNVSYVCQFPNVRKEVLPSTPVIRIIFSAGIAFKEWIHVQVNISSVIRLGKVRLG
jgi:hypothetical protein